MLDTFIKSKGMAKTIIHNNNKNYYDEVNWDADYDGQKANISLDINENGIKEHVKMEMDNDELTELLNIPSENKMLDKRLYNDFLSNRPKMNYKLLEIPKDSSKKKKKVHFNNLMDDKIYTHISSPVPQEEILIPLTIYNNKTHKQHRHHRKPKAHSTYKIYRRRLSLPNKTLRKHKGSNRISRRSF